MTQQLGIYIYIYIYMYKYVIINMKYTYICADVEDLEIRKEIIDDIIVMVQLHDTTARYIYTYIYICINMQL
jgi:hypothetical protein